MSAPVSERSSNMTLEERIEMLESELARLRGKPVVYASVYGVAAQNIKAYYESEKKDDRHYGAKVACEQIARDAFKDKHGVVGKRNNTPTQYIRTEADGEEYFGLFKAFFAVYQNYLYGEPV